MFQFSLLVNGVIGENKNMSGNVVCNWPAAGKINTKVKTDNEKIKKVVKIYIKEGKISTRN